MPPEGDTPPLGGGLGAGGECSEDGLVPGAPEGDVVGALVAEVVVDDDVAVGVDDWVDVVAAFALLELALLELELLPPHPASAIAARPMMMKSFLTFPPWSVAEGVRG